MSHSITGLQKMIVLPALFGVMLAGSAALAYTNTASAESDTKNTATGTLAAKIKSAKAHGAFGGRGGHGGPGKGGPRGDHGVMGKVTAVNGSTITVTGHDGKSYTINAEAATVKKMVTGTLSDITVGESIGVQGTVTGTTVNATQIMDGMPTPPAPNQ